MSHILLLAIQLAGVLHLVIAAANFPLSKILRYRENLDEVTPIIRQIFYVHSFYIVLVLIGFGAMCIFFPGDLRGASALGKFLTAFLALFWLLRVVIQLGFYDRETKRQHPAGNYLFIALFAYLAIVFSAATFAGK